MVVMTSIRQGYRLHIISSLGADILLKYLTITPGYLGQRDLVVLSRDKRIHVHRVGQYQTGKGHIGHGLER